MNSLSWFLYLAEVLENLGICAAILGGLGLIGLLAGTIGYACEKEKFWKDGWKIGAPIIVFLFLISILTPSKKTMYAIAASEFGERLAQNEAVQGIASDASKALQQWIKRQIEPEKK